MNRQRLVFLVLVVVGVVLDLGSKIWVFHALRDVGRVVIIDGFLNFTLSRNPGAAFGIFKGQILFFIVVSLIAIGAIGYFVWQARPRDGMTYIVSLGLLVAGILGNLYDRIRFGEVRDFIDVYAGDPEWAAWLQETFGMSRWPTFNLADAFIVVGAILLFILSWFMPLEGEEDEEDKEDVETDRETDAAEPEHGSDDELSASSSESSQEA